MDLYPARDKVDRRLAVPVAATYPVYLSPLESDSKDRRGVYMVRQVDQLPEKTAKEIQREAEEEITWAAHSTREADKGKRHKKL
jgi:hypothetical protein